MKTLPKHWHCKNCGNVLELQPHLANILSFYCDHCLIEGRFETVEVRNVEP